MAQHSIRSGVCSCLGHGSFRGLINSRNMASEGWHPYVPGAVTGWRRSGESGAAEPRPGRDIVPPDRAEFGSCVSGHGRRCTTVEVTIVAPDAMHDDGELASDRHLGAASADPCSKRKAPAAQPAIPHLPG